MTPTPVPPINGRHSPKTVAYAREMAEAGWTPHEIQRHLGRGGIPVSYGTVKAWVDDDYRVRRNRISLEDKRVGRDKSGEHLRRRIVELSARGLSYRAITVVLELYHDRKLSEEMVRNVLRIERGVRGGRAA